MKICEAHNNHARRTRKVQIIKMQKVERLDPGLNLPVLMSFNPLKGLDDPGGELFVYNPSRVCCLFWIHSFCAPEQSQVFIHKFNVVSKHNSPLNQSTGLLLSIPMDSEREEGELSSSSFLLFFFKYFKYFVYVDPKTHWSLPQMPLGTARHKAQKGGIYGSFSICYTFYTWGILRN